MRKQKQLAYVTPGHSQYDDKFWFFLSDFYKGDENIDGYDYAKYFPYFLMAGASIESKHDDLYITIKEVDEYEFIIKLNELLTKNGFKNQLSLF